MVTLVTGGGFDVLHANHQHFLDTLIASTNPERVLLLLSSDDKLAREKGIDRPLYTYDWRKSDLLAIYPQMTIISMTGESIASFSPYINNSSYLIGARDYYKDSVVDNLITLPERPGHHTSTIVNLLKQTTNCDLINVSAVLIRHGSVVTASTNGGNACIKCSTDIQQKCQYPHAEEKVLSEALPGDDLSVTCSPCIKCAELIISKRIRRVVYLKPYVHLEGIDLLIRNGVQIRQAGV